MSTSPAARPAAEPIGHDKPRLQIASICRLLPTPDDASAGTFILNRLAALARVADVNIVQPVPFFPAIRPTPSWARERLRTLDALQIVHAPMFYVPGVFKSLDGHWLARSIRKELHSLRERGRLQLIDAHFGYPEGVGCAQIAGELGLPYFITIRGLETDVLERPEVSGQLMRAMQSASGIISVSHSLRSLVVDRGVDADQVLVAPNAVDRNVFRPGDRSEARARLGVEENEKLIVSVGHLLSVKRHTVLLDALARLRQHEPVKLAIIGGPSHEPQYPAVLKQQVESARLGDAVRFAGKLPPSEVAHWLRAANVFALASAREGCCNAVLEALATGVAVVATRVGDNPHFVQDGVNGYLAPPDDADALAYALQEGLARQWSPTAISGGLSVGTWADTASRLVEFMETRIAPGSGVKRLA